MARKNWHVSFKVKNPKVEVTEFLRYSGVISVYCYDHQHFVPHSVISVLFPVNINEGEAMITIHEPKGIDGKRWAEMNAKRIASFGIKTIAWSD